jgi:photosystem II stability/assembly factor-like uncharacterized protein
MPTFWSKQLCRRSTLLALSIASAACHDDPVTSKPVLQTGWQMLSNSPVTPTQHFQDGWFLNENEGWVVGIYGDVFHTGDGGTTWSRTHDAPNGASFFRSVVFVSPTRGWVGDLNNFNNPLPKRSLWETEDGGETFTNISDRIVGPEPVGICGMWSVDAQTIFAVGRWSGPAVFVSSTDGGATWRSVSLAPMMTGAVDVYFRDRLHGIVVGGRGVGNTPAEQNSSVTVILSTDDGGATWTERYAGTQLGHWAWKISFPTPLVGYVATQGPADDLVTLKTTDGGMTWTESVISSDELGLSGAGFVSATTGWVGGETGAFETTDGGNTWQKATWAGSEAINRFRMLSSGKGYAIGKHIFKYTPPD